ncbi:hypothetical protein KAR91_44490 [Candidatus Pacearchaeota archaeon]|nr:hypothetical protein [Candidatus Pacearchaeota archaeon]
MSTIRVNTLQDMMNLYGPMWGRQLYEFQMGAKSGIDAFGMKADAPLLSATSGNLQEIIAARLWAQMNQENNYFMAVGKEPWGVGQGWRAATTAASTQIRWVADSIAALGDTVKPGLAIIKSPIKFGYTNFNESMKAKFEAEQGETISWEQFKMVMAGEHQKGYNKILLQNVSTITSDAPETIDRIVSSYSEVTNCADVDAGDSDIYGLDRDAAASWSDATVLHNSDANRPLTMSLINELYQTCLSKGIKTEDLAAYMWVTGFDTWQKWSELDSPKQRFNEAVFVPNEKGGLHLAQPGTAGGFLFNTFNTHPIILSNDVVKDGSSRLYLQNNNFVKLAVGLPTQYYEAGLRKGTPIELDAFADEGMFATGTQMRCYWFAPNGKLRDLSA